MSDDYMNELLTVDGFIARYEEFCTTFPTYRAAYDAVERQHFNAFGRRKYSDYDTFRVILCRRNQQVYKK